MKLAAIIASISLVSATPAFAETMSNDTVVSLAKAGLGEGLIVDKINSEPCGYDVTTDGILALKRGGLSDGIISAMVRRCTTLAGARGLAGNDGSPDPSVRHSPGIYILQSWQPMVQMQMVRPSKSSGMKTSGNGSILFPLITKIVVPGSQGHTLIPMTRPVFYFYFNPSDTAVSDFGTEQSGAAQSPDEFSLIKFSRKGDGREIEFGRASAYGGSVVSMRKGVNTKSTLKFESHDVGAGIFKVSLDQPLDAGEYAFVFTGAGGTARIYDFSIMATLVSPPIRK